MNLENELERKLLSQRLSDEIDQFCIQLYNDGPRSHLGASEIGHNCSRYLWYKFRWMFYKVHSGSQYRLFQRGHFEEPRFKSYAEGIGFTIKEFAKVLLFHPESDCYFYGNIEKDNADGLVCEVEGIPYHEEKAKEAGVYLDKGKRQIRIFACKGHFGGSVDGIGFRTDVGHVLTEWKTQGIGKKGDKFEKLKKEGVKKNKPVHYAQMSIYGFKLGLKYAIYVAVNKLTDELYVEFVKLDWKLGEDLERKAEMVIFSETPPNGISCSPSYFECSYCDAKLLCHMNDKPLVNCRSCKNAFPVEESNWLCRKHNAIIPKDDIGKSYECWESLI